MMESRWMLRNMHCLFTLKTILIVYLHWKLFWLVTVNKQWVLHNLHRESILNKYDHLIQLMEQNTQLWKADQPQFVSLGLGHTGQKWTR